MKKKWKKAQVFNATGVKRIKSSKMDCKKIENQLIFFLDDELSFTEKKKVKEHIEACPECASQLAYIKESLLHLDDVKIAEPKPFMYTRIQARSIPRRRENLNRVFAPLSLVAVLVVGLFLGAMVSEMTIPKSQVQEYQVAFLFDDAGLELTESYLID